MKNRYIPLLETLEEKLPPGNPGNWSELAANYQAKTSQNDAPPLAIISNITHSPLRRQAADLSVAPVAKVAYRSSSLANPLIQLSVSDPLASLETFSEPQSDLSKPFATTLIDDFETGMRGTSAPQNLSSTPANPSVQPPAFTDQWVGSQSADLELLTSFLSSLSTTGNEGDLDDSGPITANGPGGDWGYHIDNHDGYSFELNTVTFSGTGFTAVSHDLGSQAEYELPHWKDFDHNNKDDRTQNWPNGPGGTTLPALPGKDMGQPVSFARNTQMQASINVDRIYYPPPPEQPIDNYPNDKTVYLHGMAVYDSLEEPLYTEVITVGDPKSSSSADTYDFTFDSLMNTVFHWGDMEISWQYAYTNFAPSDDSPAWSTFNESHNANYVTLAKSTATKLFLTLAYNGTLSAHGASDVDSTIAMMWSSDTTSGISHLSMHRSEDDKPLYYYGNWSTTITSLSNLLKDASNNGGGDGQCRSWAEFWNQELASHGISSAIIKIVPKSTDTGFLVKNWSFHANVDIDFNNQNYKYANGYGNPLILNNSYNFTPPPLPNNNTIGFTDDAGLVGQNTSNPRSIFENHVVVKYMYTDNGVTHPIYYDPSYGKKYLSLLDFDLSSLSGYYADFGAGLYLARKNDANKLVEEVKEST